MEVLLLQLPYGQVWWPHYVVRGFGLTCMSWRATRLPGLPAPGMASGVA